MGEHKQGWKLYMHLIPIEINMWTVPYATLHIWPGVFIQFQYMAT